MVEFDQIENEFDLYERGRMLKQIVMSPAWSTVVEVLRDYRDKAVQELVNLAPGDPTVPTAHAAASALDDQFNKFQQDIQNAVDTAAKPSDELREYLLTARKSLDVKQVMEAQSPGLWTSPENGQN